MNTKARKDVSSRIKAIRVKSKMTQQELADTAGIDRKTINRIENGHFSPSLDTFFRICYALSIKPSIMIESVKL